MTSSAASLAEMVRFGPDVYGVRYQNHVSLFIVEPSVGALVVDPIGLLMLACRG